MENYEFSELKDDHRRMEFIRHHIVGIKHWTSNITGDDMWCVLIDNGGTMTASTFNQAIDNAIWHARRYPNYTCTPAETSLFWDCIPSLR